MGNSTQRQYQLLDDGVAFAQAQKSTQLAVHIARRALRKRKPWRYVSYNYITYRLRSVAKSLV